MIFELLRFAPLNLVSAFTGSLARATRPRRVIRLLIRVFCEVYRIDLSDARRPLHEYTSLDDFFTRELRDGARPIGKGVVAPADSVLTEHGRIQNGMLIQAKGRMYSLERFLGSRTFAADFDGGCYLTFYLAPPDYHRVHAPCSGTVTELVHIPGRLWPVNRWAVSNVPQLFCENERLVIRLQSEFGPVAVVMVGALNVGSIETPFSDLRTNGWAALRRRQHATISLPEPRFIESGEGCGTFHLGSSVVVLLPPLSFEFLSAKSGSRVRVGETLGAFQRPS